MWRPEPHFLDMVISLYTYSLAMEGIHCVLCELLVEHWEHLWGDIVDSDFVVGDQVWVEGGEVFVDNVVELCGDCRLEVWLVSVVCNGSSERLYGVQKSVA